MRVVLHEMRKIWGVKILVVIAVLCGLFYLMNLDWFIRHAQIATSFEAQLNRELAERYGTRITPEQMEAFFGERFPELIAELEYYIAREPAFAEMGIATYVDFMRATRGQVDWETWSTVNSLMWVQNADITARLFALELMQNAWDDSVFQMGMDLEFERYGFSEWRSHFFEAMLASDDVPALLAEMRPTLVKQADEFIAGNSLFAENGITTYEEFVETWGSGEFVGFEQTRLTRRLWFTMLGPESGFAERKIGSLDDFARIYENAYTRVIFEAEIAWLMEVFEARRVETTDFARRRIETIIDNDERLNIMDFGAFRFTTTYFGWLAILAALATMVLIMPLVTVDRMRNMQSVQYTAKLGRRLLYRQIAAAVLSAVVLTTLLLAIFGGVYFRATGVLMFWEHGIFSFQNQAVFLFGFTFGQYLLVLVAFVYVAGISAALLAFVVSRFSRNLISATIKLIPAFAGLAAFLHFLNNSGAPAPFSMVHRFYMWTNIVGIEIIVCVVLVAISLGVALWVARREKGSDV